MVARVVQVALAATVALAQQVDLARSLRGRGAQAARVVMVPMAAAARVARVVIASASPIRGRLQSSVASTICLWVQPVAAAQAARVLRRVIASTMTAVIVARDKRARMVDAKTCSPYKTAFYCVIVGCTRLHFLCINCFI